MPNKNLFFKFFFKVGLTKKKKTVILNILEDLNQKRVY